MATKFAYMAKEYPDLFEILKQRMGEVYLATEAAFGEVAGAMKWKTIEVFVTAYYEKFSCLPTGIHSVPRYSSMNLGSMELKNIVGEFEVRFPDNEP